MHKMPSKLLLTGAKSEKEEKHFTNIPLTVDVGSDVKIYKSRYSINYTI